MGLAGQPLKWILLPEHVVRLTLLSECGTCDGMRCGSHYCDATIICNRTDRKTALLDYAKSKAISQICRRRTYFASQDAKNKDRAWNEITGVQVPQM